jgi:hypothetical protein
MEVLLGGKMCECMRDSKRDKQCPKWMSANGLIRIHHEERIYWNGKNERSVLEVLKTGRGVEEGQLLQKCYERMSQRTWRCIRLCVQHQGAHTD